MCSVLVYFAVLVLVLFVYHFLSDGDFSFLMTLGSMLTLVAFGMLVTKVIIHKGTSGISIKSLQAFALVFAGRLCSILVSQQSIGAGRLVGRLHRLALPTECTSTHFIVPCEPLHAPLQFYEGYLPFDKSGDWFYQACEVLALLMVLGILAVTMAG